MEDFPDLPEELLALRLGGYNDGVQRAVRAVLSAAENVSQGCDCQIFSRQDVAGFLKRVAYELDKDGVIRASSVDKDSSTKGLSEEAKQKLRRVADMDQEISQRRHIVPSKPWKEALGFEESETPSEKAIKKAFRDKAKEVHPDLPSVSSDESFKELNSAMEQAMLELHGPREKLYDQPIKPEETRSCPKCGKAPPQV
jgi:hypothetical protein